MKDKVKLKTNWREAYLCQKQIFKSLFKAHATLGIQKLEMHKNTKIHSTGS